MVDEVHLFLNIRRQLKYVFHLCFSFSLDKQIKDILKGSLRFNQSQLEAEENEEITIEDDHYCSHYQSRGARDSRHESSDTQQQLIPPRQPVKYLEEGPSLSGRTHLSSMQKVLASIWSLPLKGIVGSRKVT